ncbi:hypothetical protein PTT_12387 [Pyrenophora teres f. teres 0-1]|uniref:Uncharacterized protein n=1 Tax=Pyrenophora teres f. teres (strain 0-1) TaxID=861557 RepID=E3RTN3_PYRTT|nr:hypothetical protein PTT_12387 [Pyrenophora teres f. teres 0-1]
MTVPVASAAKAIAHPRTHRRGLVQNQIEKMPTTTQMQVPTASLNILSPAAEAEEPPETTVGSIATPTICREMDVLQQAAVHTCNLNFLGFKKWLILWGFP